MFSTNIILVLSFFLFFEKRHPAQFGLDTGVFYSNKYGVQIFHKYTIIMQANSKNLYINLTSRKLSAIVFTLL